MVISQQDITGHGEVTSGHSLRTGYISSNWNENACLLTSGQVGFSSVCHDSANPDSFFSFYVLFCGNSLLLKMEDQSNLFYIVPWTRSQNHASRAVMNWAGSSLPIRISTHPDRVPSWWKFFEGFLIICSL